MAVTLLFRPWIKRWVGDISIGHTHFLAVAVGAVVGALVALTSVGGGSLTIVALVVLFNVASTSDLARTDVVHAAILTIAAGAAHIFVSTVDFHVTLLLLVGSLPGVIAGSRLTVRVPDTVLRLGLAGTLAFVGARLL